MSNESELLSFLDETLDERVKALSEQANLEPDFIKINQAICDFMETVTDEKARSILLEYESLKNDFIALLMPYLYKAGSRDSLQLYGLMLKEICSKC